MLVCATAVAQSPLDGDDEPDDRLSSRDRRLTYELTERGMPELVEELLAGHPAMHRVYIARAYARAAIDTPDPALRKRFFKTAAKEYRKVISLEEKANWLRGLRRFFDIAQWRVELADLILRHWIAPDLDRFEITSGLDFDRRRLTRRLEEAHELYSDAARALDELLVSLRTEEERFLLLGIGDKIITLYEHRRLNGAWAGVYLGMIGDVEGIDRTRLLETALGAFDAVARTTKDPTRKYNALLGAGIALREMGRYAEANAAFDRVHDSTAPIGLTARAKYEKARCLILAGRFDAARRELADLDAISTHRLTDENTGATFYIRLAPLIHAYTYVREAEDDRFGPSHKAMLQQKAAIALNTISQQGGIWPEIVRVYLDALAGAERSLGELTAPELRIAAGRFMAEKEYAKAIEAFQRLLDRADAKSTHAEARFNLGVCHFQTRNQRSAAEAFLAVARDEAAENLGEQATEYAYQCWRQVARASRNTADYLKLAEASEQFAERYPDHELAVEAGWVGALARQEAGDYQSALSTYLKVPSFSPHYWEARQNVARCKQHLYEDLPANASPLRRSRAAQNAVSAWNKLAKDLEALDLEKPQDRDSPLGPSTDVRARWITSARLSAATLLVGDDLRAYEDCLVHLADMQPTARVLALRIRCHRGLGDLDTAKRTLEDYLSQTPGAELGAVLIGLAAEMEEEINRLREGGHREDATQTAKESIPLIRQLLAWIERQPEHKEHVPVVRLSLAKALAQAGHHNETMTILTQLMADDPGNGSYIRTAALLQEDLSRTGKAAGRETAFEKAESLWARLLKDPSLHARAPAEYWEARFYWLRHQFRHGRTAEVLKGIETERAWHPNLGGPPWQARLLELAEQARVAKGNQPP